METIITPDSSLHYVLIDPYSKVEFFADLCMLLILIYFLFRIIHTIIRWKRGKLKIEKGMVGFMIADIVAIVMMIITHIMLVY